MKKLLIFSCLCLLVFTDLSAETGKRFHIELDFGVSPIVLDVNGYRFGGGIGVQVSRRVGLLAEFGYVFIPNTCISDTGYVSHNAAFSSVPLSGSIVFITPVTESFSAHVGLGLGYYSIKINYSTSWVGDRELEGIAPHVSLAIEADASKRITILASVKGIVGNAIWKSQTGREYDWHFSGQEIKVGLRFYF